MKKDNKQHNTSLTDKAAVSFNLPVISSFMRCDGCGLQDETVKDMGWKFCPKCDKEMQVSIDAVERNRDRRTEFDGGGGA